MALLPFGTVPLSQNEKQILQAWNGTFLEPFTFAVTSNGTIITGTLDKDPTGNLTEKFSDGYTKITTPLTIELTAGSDTSPVKNFIYILKSDKGVLVKSTSNWPTAEHNRIAEVIVQSALTTQTEGGPLVTRFWNDFTKDTVGQGHHTHAWERLRFEHAAWKSGVAITWTITTNAGSADNIDLATTAGKIYQLHLHSTEAKDTAGADNVHVVNDSTTPYTEITDFNELLTDSAGGSMSGRYFNLVIWETVSSGTEKEHLFVNLPSGSYNREKDAIADVSGYTDFNIPADFRGTAFLVTRITLRHQVAANGTWTSIRETDLRGLVPNIVAGGGTAAITTEFVDNAFKLFDEGDPTKELAFQLADITAGILRTLTVPDADGIIALTSDIPAAGATTALDNLASVQINTDLIFADDAGATEYIIGVDAQTASNTDGNALTFESGAGLGSGVGGDLSFFASTGGSTGAGGNILLSTGKGQGGGSDGQFQLLDPGGRTVILDTSSIATTDKTFTFPNETGTFALNRLTTKGDLLTFSTNDIRLGVGADDEVLTADSAQASGIKWAAPAAGASIELDNLGTTAINTSLISDTDSEDDLGALDKYWANAYIDKILFSTTSAIEEISGDLRIKSAATFWTFTRSGAAGILNTASGRMRLQAQNETLMTLYADITPELIQMNERVEPNSDSSRDLGGISVFWDETFTDELILTNVGAAAAAADKLVLSAIDLSAGNTILDINTEGTGVTGTGTPAADRTVAIRVNGEIIYLIGSTVAS